MKRWAEKQIILAEHEYWLGYEKHAYRLMERVCRYIVTEKENNDASPEDSARQRQPEETGAPKNGPR